MDPLTTPSNKINTSLPPAERFTNLSILQKLFNADGDPAIAPAIELAMSESETKSNAPGADSLQTTPGSSHGTDTSASPSVDSPPLSINKAWQQRHSPALPANSGSWSPRTPPWAPPLHKAFKNEGLLERASSPGEHVNKLKSELKGFNLNGEAAQAISTTRADADITVQPRTTRFAGLAPCVVVNSHMRIKIMQRQKDGRPAVPWGVQFYLASLVSFGVMSMDELIVTTGINAIRSNSNVESICALLDPSIQNLLWDSRIDHPIMARRVTDLERRVFAELDRESQMLSESPLNGVIGPPGEEMRSFGGRVIFHGRISCVKSEQPPRPNKRCQHREFLIRLLPPKLGGSCRFSRRFGSESILRLKMEPPMVKDARRFALHAKTRDIQQEISDFFSREVHIMGRRYRPFMCKDETIFYLMVGYPKDHPHNSEFDCIWDFLNHHAPFAENGRSQLGKFVQRILLGLSTTVPASMVDKIIYVPDVFGDPDSDSGERMEMTDGAASVSLAVAKDIAENLGYTSIPSAFQGRLAGSKGVWYVEPSAKALLPGESPTRWIEVRNSQKKIHFPEDQPLDLSQLVVDLLGPSRTFSPSNLSKQIILVLQSNGVPISTFMDLQQRGLRAIADDISDWEGPDATVCMRLASVVEKFCKIESLKAKRSTESAEHRAQGMDAPKSGKGADVSSFGHDERDVFFGQDGRHVWNGKPLSKHECAYEMLLVGFHPSSCAYLAELLIEIADMAMKKVIKRFAIPIARSAEAMVIPDPTGTLKEGEIQFRFSGDAILDPDTRLRLTHVPEGDVLVTRHPCLLPTDIRKVRAVVRPELSLYQDVVVFSTQGRRPLASLLSGGDYDGDLIRVFWEPDLVAPFRNADVSYADCPFEISEVFDRSEATVAEFVAEHEHKEKNERDRALIEKLVAGAFEPAVRGLYGAMHLYAAWQFGTRSREAIDLAHKFGQCMDSAKTGISIKPRVRIEDSKLYLGELPEWANDEAEDEGGHDWFSLDKQYSTKTVKRNANRPESVLCALWDEGKIVVGSLKQQLLKQTVRRGSAEDPAISGLWRQAKSLDRISPAEEEAIRNHVKVMEESFVRTNARTRQAIENRSREQRMGNAPSEPVSKSRGMPLRRVQSEINPIMLGRRSANEDEDSATTVDDLNGSDLVGRLDETIEVPAILGSASEVAARFCQWPKAFAKDHVAKMDRAEVDRLAKLRASYAYVITYAYRPRFAFEMAWRWIMALKAEATGEAATTIGGQGGQVQMQGLGCLQLPISTLDLLGLRTKIIKRNAESSRGRGVEI